MEKSLPRSVKKFIRLQKAKIRTQFFDSKRQNELINELYKKYAPKMASENVEKLKSEPSSKRPVKKIMANNRQSNKKPKKQ